MSSVQQSLYFHLTQNGNAISFDKDLNQWADLGDVSGFSCLSRPETCGPDEASLTAWVNIIDCPQGSGIMASVSASTSTGIRPFCTVDGIKYVTVDFIVSNINLNLEPGRWHNSSAFVFCAGYCPFKSEPSPTCADTCGEYWQV